MSFAETAIEQGVVRIGLDLLPTGWIAIPDFEPYNGQWLGPQARAWTSAHGSDWVGLVPTAATLDLSIALTLLSGSVGYLNWYTEVSLLFGYAADIATVTGKQPDRLFIENCANTFGQGIALLDRNSDAPSVFANFGKQFEHPFRV